MEKRFHVGGVPSRWYVIDLPVDEYNRLAPSKRPEHQLVEIRIGGAISPALATTWASDIADKLNQFDVANAAVAKLT